MQVGNKHYPPKPGDYEVVVFISDEPPEKEYEVIGMVFVEAEPEISDPKIVSHLKKEAKIHGADAIIDFHIALGSQPDPAALIPVLDTNLMKRAEAKAIIFIENEGTATKEPK
jgi:hypothetical protein